HMALAVERRGGRVGHRGDVLESALVVRQGGTDGQRDVGRRSQLQRDGGGAVAVAVPVAAELARPLEHEVLAPVRREAGGPEVEAGADLVLEWTGELGCNR